MLLASSILTAQSTSGPTEVSLAGINIKTMRIADVQKIYGQQEAIYAVPPDPYPQGTKLYKWGRLTVTLKAMTEPSVNGEIIRAIEIQGEGEPGDKPINKTGRGLKLGAKSKDIQKIYGVEPATPETKIQWPDGTTLIIGMNEKGHVSKLELRAP
jgi:hypothetical protein